MNADEKAIHALLEEDMVKAWDAGDSAAFAALFTEDADYIVFFGKHLKGREAIAEEHRTVFTTFLKGSRLFAEITDLRFLTPTVALVHMLGTTTKHKGGTPPKSRNSIQTFILVKQPEDKWQITAFQNTRIKSMKFLMFLARFSK